MSDTILAIDFGTSNSLVGAVHQGKKIASLALDPLAPDPTLMRTLLYFKTQDICYYGLEAIDQYIENDMEGRLFRSFKSHLPNSNYLGTIIDNRIMTLENMVGFFLLELKKRSEKKLGAPVNRAVIGRPARYSMDPVADSLALHRMQKAADFAGFKEVQFVPEPLAAAFDYRKQVQKEKIILVGDFGGGTSDFTLIKLRPDNFDIKDVLAIDGCPLAGDALDSVFMRERLNEHFGAKTRYRLPMSSNILTMPPGISQRLNHPAHIAHLKDRDTYEFIREVGKCSLSAKEKMAVDRLFILMEDQQIFPFFEKIELIKRSLSDKDSDHFEFDYPGLELKEEFSKKQFVDWCEETREKIFAALDRCFEGSQLKPSDIDLVCLTGGTAKVPFVRAELEKRFGKEKLQTQSHFHSVLAGLVESAQFWHEGQKVT